MKRLLPIFLFCFLWSTVFAQGDSTFVLVREDNKAKLYERWITFPESDPPTPAREVKGEFYINESMDNIVKLIRNEKLVPEWQKNVSEYKIFHPTDSSWVAYAYHDIPWPVSDQDHLLCYKIKNSSDSAVFIEFNSCANDKIAPVKKGVTRMTLSGSWRLEKRSDNKVKVVYRILSKPIGIPKFITDPIIRNNLMSTITSFIEIAER